MPRRSAHPDPHPPKPRCVFRVAITGHRWDRLHRASAPAVRAAVLQVLEGIEGATQATLDRYREAFADQPARLVLLSALAEGADRLAAEVALETGRWELHAVLPYDATAYERDFALPDSPPDSLDEFRSLLNRATRCTTLDGPSGAFDAYVPLGRVLVDQSDLVIAVWDGHRGRGPGGTANVITRARRDEVPVVRIDAAHPERPWLEASGDVETDRRQGLAGLPSRIGGLLEPPEPAAGWQLWFREGLPIHRRAVVFDRIVSLFHDPAQPGHPGWFGRRLRRSLGVRRERAPGDPARETEMAWQQRWASVAPEVRHQVAVHFAALHGWADQLARWYAAAFRQSFSWVFLLAWIATLASLLIAIGFDVSPAGISVMGVGEVLVLGVVYGVVRRGRRTRYHERWLDYRSLAERVRHLAILWPLTRTSSLVRLPAAPMAGDARTSWIAWLLRAAAREAGLVAGELNQAHAAACRRLLVEAELAPQQAFHHASLLRAEDVQRPLERLGERLFLLATVLALIHVALGLVGHRLPGFEPHVPTIELVLAIFGVSLPAIGASVHGFLGTADFEGIATRAADLEPRLRELEARLDRLDPLNVTAVGDVALDAASLMERELTTWRTVAETRRLTAI